MFILIYCTNSNPFLHGPNKVMFRRKMKVFSIFHFFIIILRYMGDIITCSAKAEISTLVTKKIIFKDV